MKRIKKLGSEPIAIARFDTLESVTFEQGTEIDLDDATADYLLAMIVPDGQGNDIADFIEVTL